jgi:hypothetical protein
MMCFNRIKVTRLILLVLFCFAFVQPAFAGGEVRYTKYNIHTQSKNGKTHKASYANYTDPGAGHIIIPAGSEITVTKKKRKAFYFTFDGGKKVVFEYHQPRMGMSIDEYIDKVTSAEPIALKGLSKLDSKGVAEGKALVGMTRKGVMAALGYPATHRTPSPDSDSWVYWTNRFGTTAVEFGSNGKVVNVR